MKFMRIKPLTTIAAGLSLAMLLHAPAAMAQIKERNLKFGHFSTGESTYGQGAYKFAEIIKEKSDGKIKVTIYNSAQLGNEVQQVGATQGGLQDFFLISSSPLTSIVPHLQVLDFPGLLTSKKIAYALLDGSIGREMLKEFEKRKLVGLEYWENGFRQFTNNVRPINDINDFNGLKVRVIQNPIYLDMFQALGTHAVAMPFAELYTALETKVVDGQDNTIATDHMSKFYEVQKYLTITNHVFNPMMLVGSKKLWDGMSDEEREIIQSAATEAGKFQRELADSIEKQQILEMEKQGLKVNYFTDEQTERMKEKMSPVISKYSKQIGEDFVKKVYEEVGRISARD
ncbi:TRAP transporter substrate-binding protein [Allopusillimonas ginsengisoli]|uniref:TRAP transporter substrate-binding protein n=1 Tax=Allopusillimonas ginsengisoli TaxID=453575 RepID=UPI00101FC15A|nr:TRAP transporter substrate-binding protein [Allopusillimonas ginsengisoli]TEA80006.1 TRAP transporter substrate-binding protein [Allopusillimonas ginsengisoli]